MKKVSKVWIAAGIVLIAAVAAWLLSGNEKKEEIAFDTAKVAKQHHGHGYDRAGYIGYRRYTGVGHR